MLVENEQNKNEQSFYYLDLCCHYVGEKYGNILITNWTNGDFVKLSSLLSQKTEIHLSPSTLKRIFGKLKTTERYYPQKATRDALASFAGFKDWEIFVEKHPRPVVQKEKIQEIEPKEIPAAQIPGTDVPNNISSSNKKWLWALIVLPVASILIGVWQMQKKDFPVIGQATLICKKPEGGAPYSASFKIQLTKKFSGDPEKFTIDFGDGKTENKIFHNALFTHYYEVPGRYYAVLKYSGLPLDTASIYLQTNQWTATASMEHDTTRVYPVKSNDLFKNRDLEVTANELFRSGVDTNSTFFVDFTNTKPLNISGDNFELTANVTTSQSRPGVRCSQVNIDVYGEKSKHYIELIKPGCVSWAHLQFSDIILDGATSDLSFIGADLSQGSIIKMYVHDKKVELFINERLVYETTYHFPLKKIYGVSVTFSGIGTVHNLVLKDLKTDVTFCEGFQPAIAKQ